MNGVSFRSLNFGANCHRCALNDGLQLWPKFLPERLLPVFFTWDFPDKSCQPAKTVAQSSIVPKCGRLSRNAGLGLGLAERFALDLRY